MSGTGGGPEAGTTETKLELQVDPDPDAPAVRASLLRNHDGGAAPVSFLELFFDLVFVFAITQISHFLLESSGWLRLGQALMIFAAVWWAWMYTTWAANWADPEKLPVRVMLLLVMLASLILSAAIPHAFETMGLTFALSYVGIQVGRTAFMAWIMRSSPRDRPENMFRITLWFVLSAGPWIAGALSEPGAFRIGWWLAALAIEYAGPVAGFYIPGLGRSTPNDWTISGSHMAERCALFIIIALGEGIVVTGATFAGSEPTGENVAAFLVAFLTSVLMWWIYFDLGARRGAEHIEHHESPGRVARNAYTYLHIPIVLGMIGAAVADEILLAHPQGHASGALISFACGGLAVYILGTGFFKRFANTYNNFPLSHLVGLGLLGLLAVWTSARLVHALELGAAVVMILAVIAIWEWGSFHGGWRERFERYGLLSPPSS